MNMKKLVLIGLAAMVLISTIIFTSCKDDDSDPPVYKTELTFKNDSSYTVNISTIMSVKVPTLDRSWVPCEFSIPAGQSKVVKNEKERNSISYSYGPSDKVKPYPDNEHTWPLLRIINIQ